MATLWTGSLTTKAQDYNVNAYVFDAEVIENSVDTTNNRSNITVNMYARGIAGYSYNFTGPTAFINIDGDRKVTSDVTYINSTRRLISSWTGNIQHNEDGAKSIRVTFNYSPNSGATYLPQSSKIIADPVTLTSIPRYATISSFTVAQRDETSLSFSFVANATCDYVWYSTNNGTNWTGLDITDGTSATFNVTGLSANTSYNCKVRVRRKDSQLNTDSSTVTKSTYDYPKVIAVGTSTLKIGNEQTLTIYNPLGRAVTIKMNKSTVSGTQLYSGTLSTSGSNISYKFTPNATTLYNSIPNDASSSCVYSVVYGSVTKSTSGAYTYEIKGDENPTFTANNWSFTSNLTALTNSNQVAIDNYSTITVTIETNATSSYGANIDKYVVKWGTGNTVNIASGSTTGNVNGNGNTLTVTVYDKRGLYTTTSKTITNVAYKDIIINNDINAPRTNGVEAGVKLNLSGTFYNAKFGTNGVQNAIYSAKYYVSTNGTTWSSAYPSGDAMKNAITTSENNFTLSNFEIHANGSSGGFTIGTRYYVKVEIKDANGLLSTATATVTITDGKIARDVYKDSNGDYHQGINGIASSDYTEKIYGKLNVTDNTVIGGTVSATGNITSSADVNGANIIGKVRNKPVASVGSDVENTAGWYKVATSTMGSYGNTDITLLIQDNFKQLAKGILNLNMRSDNARIACWSLRWLSRDTGIAVGDAIIVISDMTWTLYFNRRQTRYGRTSFHILSHTNINGDNPNYNVTFYLNNTTKESTAPTASKIATDAFTDITYPVGSIVERYIDTNPNTHFGGTWQRYGTGRVTVDLDTGDSNFNTIGKEGGASTVTLTANQSGIQSHTHTQKVWVMNGGSASGYHYGLYLKQNEGALISGSTDGEAQIYNENTSANAKEAHSNLQKYITVYRWRRTA